jgi:hypothetical protein
MLSVPLVSLSPILDGMNDDLCENRCGDARENTLRVQFTGKAQPIGLEELRNLSRNCGT